MATTQQILDIDDDEMRQMLLELKFKPMTPELYDRKLQGVRARRRTLALAMCWIIPLWVVSVTVPAWFLWGTGLIEWSDLVTSGVLANLLVFSIVGKSVWRSVRLPPPVGEPQNLI
jgi:hypothetical protein